jgi:EAL domain-containing protein (putative c-di-GMP-specific phosphodiesterase class I)
MDCTPISLPELKAALANNQLAYYYQPKISLVTGKASGAEALLRWVKPDGTVVLPAEIIPLAEQTGFIHDIALAMFPKLVADLFIIHDIKETLTISFNLTALDFETPEMTDLIRAAVQGSQINPKRLQIELTEASILNSGNPAIRENLQALVDLGITLVMDDFGTGFSSIDTLSQWPFGVIKLDKGLISRMSENPKSTAIVQSSIRMAHQLGIDIVAEGIETQDIYDFLMQAGCSEAQGYWMGHPLPIAEYLAFIKKDSRWSGLPVGLIHIAQLDHIHWRKTLIDLVVNFTPDETDSKVKRVLTEMNHTQCRLGRWIYGHGQEFKGHTAFDQLEDPHRRLHAVGRMLLNAAKRSAPHNEISDLLRMLTKESSTLLQLLQELENQAVV